ncbi:hypothetical protein PV433_04090 [Paenibacillus sp. GYB004]|uniref:hypothetical protein n=1 Tax=Paenibacillus sp. GYB004 TaxID=2994393 RepID=UPI002F962283
MRPITHKEYEIYSGRNLVHFTDYLSKEDVKHFHYTNSIHLIANGSKKSNYSMNFADRSKKFVWFHLSDKDGSDEPHFNSFWFTHFTESSPRMYKLILPVTTFSKDRLYIRPSDKAIAVEGDYVGQIRLMTSFPWYNKKIYFKKALHFSFKDSFVFGLYYLYR